MDQEKVVLLLRAEVERLSTELQETTQEKVQAAKYGLVVLEENADLKRKFADLELEVETQRLELKHIKEALAESYSNHKRATADGESREECLLQETASKEAKLTEKIEDLQTDIKQLKSHLSNTSAENDRLNTIIQDLKKECKCIETEKAQLKDEVKQYKVRENRQLQDCTELEEENISLQKQVSTLKENQVEFECLKHELKRREEEFEILSGQLDEMARLKEISEQQLEEALESLKSEREQKNELRKELSSYGNYGSLRSLQVNLEDLNRGDEDELDSGYANGGFSKLLGENTESIPGASNSLQPEPALVSDLFSELSFTEIQKLKQQLLQVDQEKSSLASNIQELQKQLDGSKEALAKQQEQNSHLLEQLKALGRPSEPSKVKLSCVQEQKDGEDGQWIELTPEELRISPPNSQITLLKKELDELHQKYRNIEATYREEADSWKAESQELAEKVRLYVRLGRQDQEVIADLESELRASRKQSSDFQEKLSLAQDELTAFTEELANMYHHICVCNNLIPNRVMLDYYKDGHATKAYVRKRKSSDLFGKILFSPETGTGEMGSGDQSPSSSCGSPCGSDFGDSNRETLNLTTLTAIIRDQIKHLQTALAVSWHHTSRETISSELEKDKDALVEEIMKLKSLLSTKREQITTLRTVLKANKQTAEVALSNLKSKYENEKSLVSETMMKLRNELKTLKEDAATFSSLRTIFASRCDQYVTQLDEMQRQLAAAEDEKKTLNSLLRMAIQQKLALTHRLETLESNWAKPLTKSKFRNLKVT
ncbi:protein bicaudal D homolog 2-like [Ornithorhynchus anatinus]|uniref:BICD cargo adaptor 2 n=1 Tax=Ornithorhynchus anatinus TaxID=9258 RepID=F7D6K9_ORNAN|nr:protein bicaudal D homolog 2-like [Ornithorhynchus anatinus]